MTQQEINELFAKALLNGLYGITLDEEECLWDIAEGNFNVAKSSDEIKFGAPTIEK